MKQCQIFLEQGSFKLTSPYGEKRVRSDGSTYTHGGVDGTRDGKTATYICPEEMDGAKVTEIITNVKVMKPHQVIMLH